MKPYLTFTLAALSLTLPVSAQATTQNEVLSASILAGWRMKSGHHMAGLLLTLAPDWKTYWRSPGEAGIPPQFDWSGSKNVESVQIHWPSPVVFHNNGMQTIGYHEGVVLPLEVVAIDPAQPIELHALVDLGICDKICMPASLQMQAMLGDAAQPDPMINSALADLPQTASDAGLRRISCTIAPIADGMRLTAEMDLPALGEGEVVVFETKDTAIWVAQAQSQRKGGRLISVTEMVASDGAPFAIDRSGVTVTVLSAGGAVEIAGCPAP